MKAPIAAALCIVFAGCAYAKWARGTVAAVVEDLWHDAFDAIMNP